MNIGLINPALDTTPTKNPASNLVEKPNPISNNPTKNPVENPMDPTKNPASNPIKKVSLLFIELRKLYKPGKGV